MTETIATTAERDGATGLGIKSKLLLAFAGVAGLTLVGSGVALMSYGRVDDAFERVTADGLPAITQSLQLAREAAEVTALAPVLLAADSQAALGAARLTVVHKTGSLTAILQKLEQTFAGKGAVERLAEALKSLDANMSLLASGIEKRLSMTEARERATAAAFGAHQRIHDRIIPLIDDAGFDLIVGLESAAESDSSRLMSPNIAKLADHQARALLDLSDLRAEANLLVGLLSEASLAPRADLLSPLGDRFAASGGRAAKAVTNLSRLVEAADLKKQLDALVAIGRGENNVFDLRHQELAATAQGAQALQATRAAASALTREVSMLVGDANAVSDQALEASGGAVGTAKMLLILIAILSIVTAGAAWIYVGRGVVARLKRLNSSMLLLARGDLTVQVPHDGKDELSAMANAVEVFKQHAMTSRELEAGQRKAQEQREARHRTIEAHIRRFDEKVGALLQALGAASRQMSAVAGTMASTADEASHQAAAVAAASTDASENVRSVAAAAEEISVTVSEITHQITQSSSIAERAVVGAERTDAASRRRRRRSGRSCSSSRRSPARPTSSR
ncbi:MAG TPA: HAMP domain-containing protein [Beijerinckiaceae bacterium]|nr:HAMP domain-containing protein [Beijerinckiaceae bacterium]